MKLSSQAYDPNLNNESTSSRYNSTPSSATFSTAYSASHPTDQLPILTGASGYDTLGPSGPASNVGDFSMNFRGMAVEDDYSARPKINPPIAMPSNIMQRPQPPPSLIRPHFNNYGFSDYSYNYDARRAAMDPAIYSSPPLGNTSYPGIAPQGLVGPPVNDIHRQQNMFYDFGHSRPPGSQFYFPAHQGVIFPPPTSSSMIPSQLAAFPASMDKKRELPVSNFYSFYLDEPD